MGPNYDSDIVLRKNLTGESMGEIVVETNIEACCPYRQNLFPLQKGTGMGICSSRQILDVVSLALALLDKLAPEGCPKTVATN